MKVLVSGGAGFIGSHTSLELLASGHEVFVVDNLISGCIESIDCVKKLSNKDIKFMKADIRDGKALDLAFKEFEPEAVVHFAGLKSVAESLTVPIKYFDVNVYGTISLLKAMDRASCSRIVFSSSATVYGPAEYLPCDELHPTNPVNPYGNSKLMVERILSDWSNTADNCRATALRYFNPVGAHPSALIGEDPLGIPANLMPYVSQVAIGRRKFLNVYGNDYDTCDGTGIRDYIHVMDLARAHVLAIEKQKELNKFECINLGSGKGTSVLELVRAFEKVSNTEIPLNFVGKREGDLPECWANPLKAAQKLGWETKFTIDEMCRDSWAWQKKNPNGFTAIRV